MSAPNNIDKQDPESIPLTGLEIDGDPRPESFADDGDHAQLLPKDDQAAVEDEIVKPTAARETSNLCPQLPSFDGGEDESDDDDDGALPEPEPRSPHELLKFCLQEPVFRDDDEPVKRAPKMGAYRRRIAGFNPENTGTLRSELHNLAQMNKYENMPIFCEYLKNHGIGLCDETMLGDRYKESALHIACVMESHDCVEVLVKYGGRDLIMKPYTSEEYMGVTSLHLAILKQSVRDVHTLMDGLDEKDRRKLLYAKGEGKDFNYKYNFVWIALHLAAILGDVDMFETLLRFGADLWVTDGETGNTVLHTLARMSSSSPQECVSTLQYILTSKEVRNWWRAKKDKIEKLGIKNDGMNKVPCSMSEALLKVENHDRLTPFTYSVFMGATDFARAILEVKHLYTFPQWDLGPTSYSLYEVSEIDSALCNIIPSYTIPPDLVDGPDPDDKSGGGKCERCNHDKPDKPSVLEVYAFGLNEQDLEFGKIAPIQWVMINKWETYKNWFCGWFFLHLIMMICLTVCLEYRDVPEGHGSNTTDHFHHGFDMHALENITAKDIVIHILEIFVLIMGLIYFITEIMDVFELYKRRYWKGHGCEGVRQRKIPMLITIQFDVHRVMLFTFSVAVLLILVLRIVNSVWQDLAYAIAVLAGWGFLMFFMQASENMGIFIVMMRQMIMRDLAHFSIIFFICLISFGSASYSLFQQAPNGHPEEVHNIPMTLFSFFRLLVGLEELSISNESRIPWMMKILFILFVLASNILLLNMIIAAMSSTYTEWESLKKPMWMKTRTKAVLMIERRLPKFFRPPSNLEQYGNPNKWFLGGEQMFKWNHLASKRLF